MPSYLSKRLQRFYIRCGNDARANACESVERYLSTILAPYVPIRGTCITGSVIVQRLTIGEAAHINGWSRRHAKTTPRLVKKM